MAEQIYAFIAGGICGIVVLFYILVILGSTGADPDNW